MEKSRDELEMGVNRKLAAVLKNNDITAFSYYTEEDRFVLYDEYMQTKREIYDYLSYLENGSSVHPEDRWKIGEFLGERLAGPLEFRVVAKEEVTRKVLDVIEIYHNEKNEKVIFGSMKDVTIEKKREKFLEDHAKRDSLTMLYNHFFGKELINEYLTHKNPYATCGLMIVDIDYFKNVNDSYGHLFGDMVLMEFARLLTGIFEHKDVVIRSGGDEFVVFLKDITQRKLVSKAMQLVKSAREMEFEENDYSLTCSVGVCFLPENVLGYNYDQLFENADWALYRAKENGKNRYVFCDNLQRFETSEKEEQRQEEIDVRYLHNDIVSTAFEVFEKTNSFQDAVNLLLKVIAMRFHLDRITIIQTDIKAQKTSRQYQWVSEKAPKVLDKPGGFTKEDFLTLFQSYDEYGTTVLQHDHMDMYSEGARNLLMQGEARTVVYAAMYCEGKYTGAISYVACTEKRHWSKQNRKQLGEVTKIISAHLAKSQALNASHKGTVLLPEYDQLTGLLSFQRFREEVEHLIVGEYATSHILAYTDFGDFKLFNQKYGYQVGDQLLLEYVHYIMENLTKDAEAFFARIVADQFLLFLPVSDIEEALEKVEELNQGFMQQQTDTYPDVHLRVRTGIYYVTVECGSVSYAIDAANYARNQIKNLPGSTVRLYDRELAEKRTFEEEVISGMDRAMKDHEFRIYLQPKFSLEEDRIVGAEALVRWQRADGTVLSPAEFVPLYEKNGRIVELDYYVFEQVTEYLAKNDRLGRRQVPISVNISNQHASESHAAKKFREIMERYKVDSQWLEIELTEAANASDYTNIKSLFFQLQEEQIKTAMDNFDGGYSMMHAVFELPVSTVKLNRLFLKSCQQSERGLPFLTHLVAMVKDLGYRIVCEGVETKEQVKLLRQAGCDEVQGYWFAHPVPLVDFEKLLYGKDTRE